MPITGSSSGKPLTIFCAAAATYLAASMGGAVSLVLPAIAAELALNSAQAQWILAGYILARVGLLRPAGSLSDRLSPRTTFLLGMLFFAVTSLGCAMVTDDALLIGLRVLQGAAAAFLSPSTLVLLRDSMPADKQAQAMTIWSFAGIAGFSLAPAFGGLLVLAWGWPAVFYFCGTASALIGAVYLAGGKRMPVSAAARPPHPPILRDFAVSAVLVALAFLIGKDDLKATVYFLVAILLLSLETGHGILSSASIWKDNFARVAPMLAGLSGFASIAGVLLWAAYFIQSDLQRGAFAYGMACIPLAITGALSCLLANRYIAAKRLEVVLFCGGLSATFAAVFAFLAETHFSFACAVASLAAVGLCYGFISGAVSAALLDTFPAEQSGDGAAMASLSKQFGQLIGVALVSSWRDMSGRTAGSDEWLFFLLGGCGAALLIAAALFALGANRPGRAGGSRQ